MFLGTGGEHGTEMGSGLNTEVEHAGRVYHVQTENASRPGPAVETLIFFRGEILVRMTASHDELVARSSAAATDMRQALELQHWDLVRKVRRGMLDDGARPLERAAPSWDLSRSGDAGVRELLDELDGRLAEIFAAGQPSADRRPQPRGGVRRFPLADWWRRQVKRVSVVVRW